MQTKLFLSAYLSLCLLDMRHKILATVLVLIWAMPAFAQSQTLYVSVLETRGFIVGSDNASSGLYRQDPGGGWTHLGWSSTRNFGIDIAPANPEQIFLACGNGVIASKDGGAQWRILTGWRITEVLDISINRNKPAEAYIATAHGIWRTVDGGMSWVEAMEGIERPRQSFTQAIEADLQEPDKVLAGTEVGLFESINAGRSWQPVGPTQVAIRDIRQSDADAQRWLAGTEDRGVLQSDDDGSSWQFAKGGLAKETIYAVAIDPHDPQRMAAGGYQTGVYVTTNGGKRWRKRTKGLSNLTVHALQFDPEVPGKLWAGTVGGGLFSSADTGRSWQHEGLDGAVIYDMIFVGGKR